jgi:hypothetical protein
MGNYKFYKNYIFFIIFLIIILNYIKEYQKSLEMFEGHYKIKSDDFLFIIL